MSKKLENKKYFILSGFFIWSVSIIFALLNGSGFYGFGIDYYGAYIKGFEWSIARATFFNYFSYWIATLTINNFYIGVYLVALVLSLSTGFLIRSYLKLKQIHSLFFFLIIFIIAIHTWPIIMSSSNAMRQGLAMSFMFLSLISTIQKNYYYLIIFSFISILSHLSGLFFTTLIFIAIITYEMFKNFSGTSKIFINLIIGISLFITSYYLLKFFFLDENFKPSRIIAGDFRAHFVLIAFIYIFFSFFFKSMMASPSNLFLYYFSFVSVAFLIVGLNWQFERLWMMVLIPYIMFFGTFLDNISYKMYLISIFILLFFLTIYTGMYSIGLT